MKMLTLLGIFIFSISAFAMNGRTTYQAKIIKPDGYPLEASSVNFRFTVLDTVGSCVLYVEDYTAVNMSQSGGLISFALGNGARSFPASGTSMTFQNTFDNSVTSFSCQTPGIYNPLPTDTRRIVMQFNDGNGWQTLPAMTINAVPYAMYATKSNDSKTLNGKADTAFVENATLAALNCNPATHAITFNGVSFSCIPVGSSSSGITSVTTSGTVLTTGGTASAPVISITAASISQDGYLTSLDYAEFKAKLSASSTQIVNTLGYAPVSGAAVASQINNSNLSGDVSGTISSNSVISVGGKSSSQISTSVDDTLAATSSATADTIVKRNSSGNFTANDIYANSAKINYVDIYKPSTSFNIRLQAPTSLSTNYVLNLPTTSGTTGQVLSTDGAGNLSWINAATGSVTSVSGTANEITSSGGSTPSLGLADAGTAGTYYKVTTDNKGRVTSGVATLTLSDLPNTVLNTTSTFAGDISGIISNITVNRIQGVSVTVTSLTTNDILQYDGSKYINKNIPTCSGSQYLTFNGTSFSCVVDAGSSGTIASLSVTGPISSTGGSNPTLSIAQANSSTDGYLSSANWNTFNNKQNATSAAIIATLGYTPADNAASGTYTQKANNLSDLTNAATARTNLGLGTLAVGNSIDLGSASATGIIADARLQTQSNVTSGTQYTKVTVDGKGRVTSGAQLSSSDVTTALGFTPANDSASGTYLVKASNLSDLSNVATARTNLGLGTFATASTVDLGSASATGTLALARLPSFVGDATVAAASNTIILSNSGVTAGTYTKVTVDGKGRVTSSSALSSSDVTTALGFTPADNAASGTYLVKASNLSDLTNAATARNNLGLGGFATVSSLDLGSASATGTIADARIANQSNVTSGTQYTKVTVDGKGRVTSGAQLSSSDVTTALGFTPANVASGVTSLNGSTSQTQTFAVSNTGTVFGITTSNGVHTFAIPLAASSSVTAGLLSNTDYTTFTNKQNATSAAIIATLGYTPANATSATQWTTNGANIYYTTGNIGVGIINPSAKLELASGTASVAPLKFTSGTLLTSAQSGTMEYDGFNFYLTDSTNTRRSIATGSSAGTIDNASNINSSGNITMTPVGSVIVSSTTASTNSNTGALVVKGGLGVAGNINTAGNLNVSGSSVIDGSLKLSSMTSGSVLFSGANGTVTQDNSSLYWDGANKRLGIGGNSPAQTLSVSGTSYFSGNVGIGTTNPQRKLDVAGEISAQNGYGSTFYIGGDSAGDDFEVGSLTASKTTISFYNRVDSTYMDIIAKNATLSGYLSAPGFRVTSDGKVGVGTTTPTAQLHLAAGTSTLAPFKFTSGTLLTSPQSGTMEYDGTNFYLTDSTNTRRAIAANANPGTYDNVSNINSSSNITLTPTGSVVVSSTTASTNSGTGALVVKGGLGVAGDIYTSGTIVTSSNIQGVSVTATSGMISPYIAGSIASGGSLTLDSTTHSTKGNILLAPSGGNVGIGITAPQQKLHLGGAGIFRIQDNDDTSPHGYLEFGVTTAGSWSRKGYIGMPGAGSAELAIAADGAGTPIYLKNTTGTVMTVSGSNVGIGTTNPAAPLDVNQTAVLGGTAGNNILVMRTQSAGGSGGNSVHRNEWRVRRAAGTDWTTHKIHDAISVDVSYLTPGTDTRTFWERDPQNDIQSWGTGASTYLTINAGNVGIGTTSPNAIGGLHISRNSGAMLKLQDTGNTVSTYFTDYAGYSTWSVNRNTFDGVFQDTTKAHAAIQVVADTSNSYIALGTSPTNNTIATERMRITKDGNVGIGTINPASKLTVSGGQIRSEAMAVDTNLARIPGNSEIVIETAGDGATSSWLWREKWAASNYGIFHDNSADNVVFVGNNNPRLSVGLSSGNVGIGTTSPSQKLDVFGNQVLHVSATDDQLVLNPLVAGSGANLYVTNSAGNAYRPLNMQASTFSFTNGNVGIGTTSPSSQLHVYKNTAGPLGSAIEHTSGTAAQYILGSGGSYIGYLSTQPLYIGTTTANMAAISAKMTLDVSGNVGIGTTSPAVALDVAGVGGAISLSGSGVASPSIGLAYGIFPQSGRGLGLYSAATGAGQGIGVWTNKNGTTPTEVMTILRDGYVGIGTTAPGYTLDVSGTLRVTGTAYTNGGYTTWTAASDSRLKDIHGSYDRGLDDILGINIIKFQYKADNKMGLDSSKEFVGVTAQNLQTAIPEAVTEETNGKLKGYLTINTTPVLWTLVNAVKQLYKRLIGLEESMNRQIASIVESKADKVEIEALREKAAKLESKAEKVDKLEAENAELKNKAKEFDALKAYLCSKDPAAPICK